MSEIKVNLENLSSEEREQLMALVEKANTPYAKRSRANIPAGD